MPYDPGTDAGKVRLLISDTNDADPVFNDQEIDVFLELSGGSIRLAAALGLETIAGNEILVQKRIRNLDLQTDGPAEAKELRALAERWRKDHEEETLAADEDLGFDIAEFAGDEFSLRTKLENERLRNLL